MSTLLDGNVLIALLVDEHIHHASAERWWHGRAGRSFATTPSTQGTLVRFLVRAGLSASVAADVLTEFTSDAEHEFWADEFPYDARLLRGVIGHRQVTDAYLAAHARSRGGRLATFDQGLVTSHADIAVLVPTLL